VCTTRRFLAAIVGLWLVVCGILGQRHASQVAHYTDGRGEVFHASGMVGSHTTESSDIHASGGALDHDACEIAAARHHTGSAHVASPAVSVVVTVHQLPRRATVVVAIGRLVFRIAPKTSPPRIA
jgi:hypothetical protein